LKKKSFFYVCVEFSQDHSLAVIIVTLLLTVFFAFFALQTKLNPDFNTLLPPDDQSNIDFLELYGNGDYTDNFIVLLEGDDLFSPESLELMQDIIVEVEAYSNMGKGIHPFSLITAEKKGTRLSVSPMSIVREGEPWTRAAGDLLKEKLLNDDTARNLIISEDGKSLLLYFPSKVLAVGNTEQMKALSKLFAPLEQYAEVSLNGSGVFTDRIMFYLQKDLIQLLAICFLIILLIYYISFRAKRAVILPMSVVVFGTIWCLGTVALLGYELTIINIITPPLVLTLGSSYSIHLLNEYFRTHPKKMSCTGNEWILDAVCHINKTVFIAGLTTIAGFLSLLATQIHEFRQFGISTSFGIFICVILTLFYLPAVLSRLPNPSQKQYTMLVKGRVSRFIKSLAGLVVKRWPYFLAVFFIAIAGFIYAYPRVTFETSYVQYFPDDDDAIVGLKKMIQKVGGLDAIYITIDAPEDSVKYFLDPENLRRVDAFETAMKSTVPELTHILSFSSYIRFLNKIMTDSDEIPDSAGLIMLLSRYIGLMSQNELGNNDLSLIIDNDANRVTTAFRYASPSDERLSDLQDSQSVISEIETYAKILPSECSYTIWGQSRRFIALSKLIESDQRNSTLVSLLVVLVIAWVTFRSFKFGVLALLPILFGIMTNYIFMFLLNIPFDMVTIAFASVTVGVGIDDAVHFILRFKSLYFNRSGSLLPAVKRTIELTGRPIMLTTFSIIGGLLVLTLASFIPIRYFGLLISLALLNTLLATLFILPSGIILWIGTQRAIEKRRVRKRARKHSLKILSEQKDA
jgi:uncharacterized protein